VRAFSVATVALFACLPQAALGQFRSATVFGAASTALTKRLGVTEATSWGGGLELQYDITSSVAVSLTGLYEYWWITQPDAINQWNWDFWIQRYQGIVQSNLASDPNLSATLTPDVVMEAIPVYLTASFRFEPLANVQLRPYAGAGIYFYTKKLYLLETWSKYFPDEDYTLTYDYRNFAPPKTGKPFLAVAGLELSYRLSEMLEIDGGVRYLYVVGSGGSRGYDEIPMENSLSVTLGIGVLY
jgi:hypothetical protein